jgi:hypothetical protein
MPAVVFAARHNRCGYGLFEAILEEEGRRDSPLPINSLIALATQRSMKRLTIDELATQTDIYGHHWT